MASYYKQEEKCLHQITQSNVEATDKTTKVKLHIYYKSRRVRNLFIKNNIHKYEPHNVVYIRIA